MEPVVRHGVALAAQPVGKGGLGEARALSHGPGDEAGGGRHELGIAVTAFMDVV
jgi:hypothetical protein